MEDPEVREIRHMEVNNSVSQQHLFCQNMHLEQNG